MNYNYNTDSNLRQSNSSRQDVSDQNKFNSINPRSPNFQNTNGNGGMENHTVYRSYIYP